MNIENEGVNLCNQCMNPVEGQTCNYCGYNQEQQNPNNYLPVQTVLKERYIIGKVLSSNSEGANYMAYDKLQDQKCIIREYAPLCLAQRDPDRIQFIAINHREAQYKSLMIDFVDLGKTLMNLGSLKGIIPITDIFSENNTAYIVKKYISMCSLKKILMKNNKYMSWYKCKNVFLSVNAILSKIHRRGIIHRGINPSNIFVDKLGSVYIDGFSIACVRTENSELEAELFEGYSAPEQYQTDGWQGTWTDVYAVAATLYTVLTGQKLPPFNLRTNDRDLLFNKQQATIPKDIAKAILGAIKINHKDRTQTIDQFNIELIGEDESSNTAVYDTSKIVGNRAVKKKNKINKNLIILSGVVIVLLVGVVALSVGVRFIRSIKDDQNVVEKIDEKYIEENAWLFDGVSSSESNSDQDNVKSTTSSVTNEIKNLSILPNFVGDRIDNVKISYQKNKQIDIIAEQEYSESPEGEIIQQEPMPGYPVHGNEPVRVILKISKGPEYVEVPNILDKDISEAESTLKQLGILYEIVPVYNPNLKKGVITSMDCKPGDKIIKNKDKIFLSIRSPQIKDSSQSQSSISQQEVVNSISEIKQSNQTVNTNSTSVSDNLKIGE